MFIIKAFNQFYIRDCGDYLEEIYDLEHASSFTSKKEAQKILDSSTYKEYFEIVELSTIIDEFVAWKKNGMVRRVVNKIDEKKSTKYNKEPVEKVIEFFILHSRDEDKIRFSDYTTWPKLYSLCKVLFDVMTYFNEEDKRRYNSISICVKKETTFEDFEKEIRLALNYIDYTKDDYFILPIMDHELSEYESRSLLVNTKDYNHCKITGRHTLCEGSLEKCFDVIKKKYYYE